MRYLVTPILGTANRAINQHWLHDNYGDRRTLESRGIVREGLEPTGHACREGLRSLGRRDRQGVPEVECSFTRTRLLGEKAIWLCCLSQAAAKTEGSNCGHT